MTPPKAGGDESRRGPRGSRAGRGRAPKRTVGKGRAKVVRPRGRKQRGGSDVDASPTAVTEQAPVRQQPSAYKLMAAVALIVALDILLFFAVGYFVGTQIL